MSEVKFRARDLSGNLLYFDVFEIEGSDLNEEHFYIKQDGRLMVKSTLERYTGLQDRVGREIYEGDIVAYRIGAIKLTGDVRWDDKLAQFVKRAEKVQGAWEYKPLASYLSTTSITVNTIDSPGTAEG